MEHHDDVDALRRELALLLREAADANAALSVRRGSWRKKCRACLALRQQRTLSPPPLPFAPSPLQSSIAASEARERSALSDCAARVAELTSAMVSRELSLLDVAVTPTDGRDALAARFRALQDETAALRQEDAAREVRQLRGGNSAAAWLRRTTSTPPPTTPNAPLLAQETVASLEQMLKETNARIAASAAQFDTLTAETQKLREALAADEVRRCSSALAAARLPRLR